MAFDARASGRHWWIDVYQEPMPDVSSCIEHQRREIAHRERQAQDTAPRESDYAGPPIYLSGDDADRGEVIILNPPEWEEEAIIMASFKTNAGDKPAVKPCQAELSISATSNRKDKGDCSMYQAILDLDNEATTPRKSMGPKPESLTSSETLLTRDLPGSNIMVESLSENMKSLCITLDKDEPATPRFCYHVYSLDSSHHEPKTLGRALITSLAGCLSSDSEVFPMQLIMHPSRPTMEACGSDFRKCKSTQGDQWLPSGYSHAKWSKEASYLRPLSHSGWDASTSPPPSTGAGDADFFVLVDKEDFSNDAGICFVQAGRNKTIKEGKVWCAPDEELDSPWNVWNDEHALAVWRAYDVLHAGKIMAGSGWSE